jgi:hypothetical protein
MSSTGNDSHRRHAAQCVELARKAPDPKTRLALLEIAQAWMALAKQADRSGHAPALIYETPEQQQRVTQQQQQPQPDDEKDE